MPSQATVVLLDAPKTDKHFFKALQPEAVRTKFEFASAFDRSTSKTIWMSSRADVFSQYFTALTNRLNPWLERRSNHPSLLSWQPIPDAGSMLIRSLFRKIIEVNPKSFLSKERIAEVLSSGNPSDLAIGCRLVSKQHMIIVVRGDLSLLAVPYKTFRKTGIGTKPDFERLKIVDCGQTIRLGEYEASIDSLLYEFDAEYRKRHRARILAAEKSFGASLKRLRLQRGLKQDGFPGIMQREIGRIERGEIARPHGATIAKLAKALRVGLDEIETF